MSNRASKVVTHKPERRITLADETIKKLLARDSVLIPHKVVPKQKLLAGEDVCSGRLRPRGDTRMECMPSSAAAQKYL